MSPVPPQEQTVNSPKPELKVMVLYEDEAACERVTSMLERVARQSGAGSELSKTLWATSMLQKTRLRERAVAEAASSDIIIIAFSQRTDLTVAMHDWLIKWQRRKDNRSYAIGVMLNQNARSPEASETLVSSIRNIVEARSAVEACCENPMHSGSIVPTGFFYEIVRSDKPQAAPVND